MASGGLPSSRSNIGPPRSLGSLGPHENSAKQSGSFRPGINQEPLRGLCLFAPCVAIFPGVVQLATEQIGYVTEGCDLRL
jgi:hypothetical protein